MEEAIQNFQVVCSTALKNQSVVNGSSNFSTMARLKTWKLRILPYDQKLGPLMGGHIDLSKLLRKVTEWAAKVDPALSLLFNQIIISILIHWRTLETRTRLSPQCSNLEWTNYIVLTVQGVSTASTDSKMRPRKQTTALGSLRGVDPRWPGWTKKDT